MAPLFQFNCLSHPPPEVFKDLICSISNNGTLEIVLSFITSAKFHLNP
jgi:hypothetical protein